MKWLNYHHLYYFWVVAREGSVSRAAKELLVSQPTVSSLVKSLENALGQRLFERAGRRLVLTEAGRVAFNYANEIFSLGRELIKALEEAPKDRPLKLTVGIVDILPKSVVRLLLEPALRLPQPVRLTCREDKADRLLADLAAHRSDVVLSDAPIGASVQLRGFNHLLGDSGISFLGVQSLAAKYRRRFPDSLDGAPVLLPGEGTALRHELNLWLDAKRIHPVVVVECDDAALLSSLGQEGTGIFIVPSVVEEEVRREGGVSVIGRTDEVRQRFYAITVEAKLSHPAVVAIREGARRGVFA
ncbi:MAG TPA: LysR family transcriptional regulator [Phycisphaerae bacterium]|nr:LysR family transcriptional regulator [Phycisphaerae bacterium]HPP21695.1 LysR family transcriptional regulator [Phycisphaerae bacterium]HQA44116.1 LysR family transcriptional regulator [Phycisphaerae bacterium]HQE45183.1 LysR family transcriptional regulator [Phycisphaerae bacterium]